MINPPAPPEIPRPTMQDFNAMVARSTTSLNQVNMIPQPTMQDFNAMIANSTTSINQVNIIPHAELLYNDQQKHNLLESG